MAVVAGIVRCRALLIVGVCGLLLSVAMASAAADSPAAGADISVAQSLGDRELTVVLRRVTSVPGPLRVDVVTHTGTAAGRLTLAVTPTGATTESTLPAAGVPTAETVVDLGGTPGMYSATVTMDRAGPWELAIGDGVRVARIPFIVPAQVTSPPECLVYGGFLVAGVLLPVAVVIAIRARRTGWALVPAAGMVAGVAVSVTAALLSASLPLPPQPGGQLDPTVDNVTDPYALNQPLISDFSRPPVLLTIAGSPVKAGQPGDLDLVLIDAATGALVDDLLVHDSALMHLLVVGPTGRLSHLHPVRIGPGRYKVHLASPEAGHHAVSAELARRGGGVQMVRAAAGFTVGAGEASGIAPQSPGTPVHLGGDDKTASTVVDGNPVTIRTTAPVAGAPTTITAEFGDAADLQPWLGMVGHMIMAGPLPDETDIAAAVQNSPVWGHGHSMGATSMQGMADMPGMDMPGMSGMTEAGGGRGTMLMPPVNGDSAADETVAAYGPDVPFTYTFPVVGRYRLWIQVERRYTVLTVPVVLDVAGARR
ncbi:hypothetical protein OG874_08135 [Nocardia sp. NBC_00565]|uniref:hypothetical protein n=1 Tax=Nocardia sp. NBC_00565 TaxID=2975993 RepID=UPI002E7FDA15|nr:hypothetical protein [Nocardia sp. NBC_00565]WUC05108.1 hypothetical protein OG874_08135 [Nocardia sp. NBC_00565]